MMSLPQFKVGDVFNVTLDGVTHHYVLTGAELTATGIAIQLSRMFGKIKPIAAFSIEDSRRSPIQSGKTKLGWRKTLIETFD